MLSLLNLFKLNLDKCSEFRTSESELLTILIHDIQPVNDWLITIHDLLLKTMCFYWSSTVIKIYTWSGIQFFSFSRIFFRLVFLEKFHFLKLRHILFHNLFHYHFILVNSLLGFWKNHSCECWPGLRRTTLFRSVLFLYKNPVPRSESCIALSLVPGPENLLSQGASFESRNFNLNFKLTIFIVLQFFMVSFQFIFCFWMSFISGILMLDYVNLTRLKTIPGNWIFGESVEKNSTKPPERTPD